MICKVKNTIEKYKLLENVSTVAVGVSGGADSMCLLHILISLKAEYDIIIKAVHINHNLRGEEAKRDENFVRDFCAANGVELTVFSEDIATMSKETGMGEEECGRKVRYDCFGKMNCDAVAVAHSLSDSVETVLFNLARGTGTKGLCGIAAKREPNIIRPIIECTRAEIEDYCQLNGLSFITDSTNLKDDYKRNLIRHRIIPVLSEINPDFSASIARASSIIKEESDFIERSALALLNDAECDGGYDAEIMRKADSAVRKRAFSIILKNNMNKDVEARHIDLCEYNFINEKGQIEITKGLYILFGSDIISVRTAQKCGEPWSCFFQKMKAQAPRGTYLLQESTYNDIDSFDSDKIKGKLLLSSRKEGDKITLESRNVTKTLKKLFNEMKIPLANRNDIAVLRDSENVVWVEGVGIDKKYLPDTKSTNVFKITKEI